MSGTIANIHVHGNPQKLYPVTTEESVEEAGAGSFIPPATAHAKERPLLLASTFHTHTPTNGGSKSLAASNYSGALNPILG